MTNQDMTDACLRVITNRCRNLRKTIDKAKIWEQAMEKGAELNEEQLTSIQSVPRKEALCAELLEIHKKQKAVIDKYLSEQKNDSEYDQVNTNGEKLTIEKTPVNKSQFSSPSSTSPERHHGPDDANGEPSVSVSSKQDNYSSNSDTIFPVTQGELDDSNTTQGHNLPGQNDSMNPHMVHPSHSNVHINQISERSVVPEVSHNHVHHQTINPDTLPQDSCQVDRLATTLAQTLYTSNTSSIELNSTDSAHISKIIHDLEKKHSEHIEDMTKGAVRAILNLFHVSDYLKQRGSRETVMACSGSTGTLLFPGPLTDLDIDLLCYFHVMLTSPNGFVPHKEAVEVSTAHCLEFLKGSRSEAFKGTTYATLAEMVHAIASSPVMSERGKENNLASQYEDPLLSNM